MKCLIFYLVSLKIKVLTVDERDELLDSCKFTMDSGNVGGMEAPHSTMTKFIRVGVDGDTSDEFIKSLSMEDKTNIFAEIQKVLNSGEETPSK